MWAVDSSFLQSLDTEQLSPAQTPRSGAPRISLRSAGHTWAGRVSSDKQVPRSYSAPILPPSSSDGTIVARECTALLSCFQPASKSRRSCLQTGSKLQLWKHVPKRKKKKKRHIWLSISAISCPSIGQIPACPTKKQKQK